jgi:hypothetical protein
VTETSDATLSNLLKENRRFEPPKELAEAANVTADAYERAEADRLAYWEEQAKRLSWATPWDTVLDRQPPFAKWFVGGQLNAAYNCVDRHVEAGHGEQVAFHWEGEPGDSRTITYADLHREVCRAADLRAIDRDRRTAPDCSRTRRAVPAIRPPRVHAGRHGHGSGVRSRSTGDDRQSGGRHDRRSAGEPGGPGPPAARSCGA